jgi:hypothetical protein
VQPLPQAVVGRPAPRPIIAPRPEIRVTPWSRPPTPDGLRPVPVNPRTAEPARPPVPEIMRPVPQNLGARSVTPERRVTPPVIARTPPAPPALPFSTRERAMRADPGRPLEPVQRQNLREGKPAGPHRDVEDPVDRRPAKPSPPPPPPKKKPDPRRP